MKLIEIGINRQQPQGFKAFIPHPFPPRDNLDFPSNILIKNEKATRLIGKLDGVTKRFCRKNYGAQKHRNFGRVYAASL